MTRTPLHALPLFATSLLVAACQPATRTPAPPPAVAGPTTPQAVAVPVVEAPPNDEAVARAAKRELATDPSVDEMAVSVVVVDGIVQLTGRVDTLLAKRRAEAIAESLRGVRAVSNRLHVDTIDVPALQLVTTIASAYALDPAAESYEIDVAASKGRVTLTGQVDSWPEKRLAVRIAEGVIGVRDVVDELEVRYDGDRADADIAADAFIGALERWEVLRGASLSLARAALVGDYEVTTEYVRGAPVEQNSLLEQARRNAAEARAALLQMIAALEPKPAPATTVAATAAATAPQAPPSAAP